MEFLIVGFIILLLSGFRITQEYQRAVVFRMGKFTKVKGPGIYWNIPIMEWQKVIDIRTFTIDVEKQEAITKDNVTIFINAVLWYKIIEPSKAILTVISYSEAVYQIALTSLRNIIGQNHLDDILKERDKINESIKDSLKQITEGWGITVELVEMKDVEIPPTMQRALAREAEATTEKRARIIKAEAELEASKKLSESAKNISENPISLELRRMQMISEIGVENNTSTIILIPSEFSDLAKNVNQYLNKDTKK